LKSLKDLKEELVEGESNRRMREGETNGNERKPEIIFNLFWYAILFFNTTM
jgi:hypothetical protein